MFEILFKRGETNSPRQETKIYPEIILSVETRSCPHSNEDKIKEKNRNRK
jgi:hypothetical protein